MKNETYNQYSVKQMKSILERWNALVAAGEDEYNIYKHFNMQESDIASALKNNNPENLVVKTFYRIGEPRIEPYDYCYLPSYNYADQRPEAGVSVITTNWLNSLKSVFWGVDEGIKAKGVWKVTGVVIDSVGGDDEILIIPTEWAEKTRIRSMSGLRKAVLESENSN